MKSRSFFVRAFSLLTLIALFVSMLPLSIGVVFAQDGTCPTAKDRYKIGFANLTEDIVFTQLVREGILETAEALGNVEIVLADNRLDGATALANTENFITQGVDAIIHFQTDQAFGNVIWPARARQISRSSPLISPCRARPSSAQTTTMPANWQARRWLNGSTKTGTARPTPC
jgi:ABC-type sugar transport system substrate-binding protein